MSPVSTNSELLKKRADRKISAATFVMVLGLISWKYGAEVDDWRSIALGIGAGLAVYISFAFVVSGATWRMLALQAAAKEKANQ